MKTEPEKALKSLIRDVFDLSEPGWGDIENIIYYNDAKDAVNIAFQEGQSYPKIKQLEWDFYGAYYSSKTPIGEYTIEEDEGYLLKNDPCKLLYNGSYLKTCTSVDEVKAAAQADFERRVMECIISE